MAFNENDFLNSTGSSESGLENTEEIVAEIPVEFEKEESEQEVDQQPEPLL